MTNAGIAKRSAAVCRTQTCVSIPHRIAWFLPCLAYAKMGLEENNQTNKSRINNVRPLAVITDFQYVQIAIHFFDDH